MNREVVVQIYNGIFLSHKRNEAGSFIETWVSAIQGGVSQKNKYHIMKVKLLSHVQFFATAWTAAYWAPPSMGFSGQGYWSGLPFPSPTSTCGI